jgi:hypothetical protein
MSAEPRFAAMAYRVKYRGPFGDEASEIIDELEGARLVADALVSYQETVCVIDTETNKTVYSRRQNVETRPDQVADRLSSRRPLFKKLTDYLHLVWSRRSFSLNLGFPRLHSTPDRH